MTRTQLSETIAFPPRVKRLRRGPLVLLVAALAVGGLWAYSSLYASEPAASESLDTHAARRQRVAALTPAEKETLARQQERFNSLTPAEQDRLRKLQADLLADPNGPQLMAVAQRYQEWLKTLSTGQRAELLDLPPEERIARIARLRRQEESRQFQGMIDAELPQEDIDLIFASVTQFIQEHEQEIIVELPRRQQAMLNRIDNQEFRTRMLFFVMLRQGPQANMPEPEPESVDRLIASLSPQARQRLENAETDEQKAEMLRQWVWAAVISRTSPEPASAVELEEFFTGLPQSQRERLESLPSERMQHELRQLYYQEEHGFRHGRWDHRGGPDREGHDRGEHPSWDDRRRPDQRGPQGGPQGSEGDDARPPRGEGREPHRGEGPPSPPGQGPPRRPQREDRPAIERPAVEQPAEESE